METEWSIGSILRNPKGNAQPTENSIHGWLKAGPIYKIFC